MVWGGKIIAAIAFKIARRCQNLCTEVSFPIYDSEELTGLLTKADQSIYLSGKAMKACYGTTKYCNAFLKGLQCNNADCLYLHDVGKCYCPVVKSLLGLHCCTINCIDNLCWKALKIACVLVPFS